MSKGRSNRKKEPKYLEDITFSPGVDSRIWKERKDPFMSELFLGRYSESRIMDLMEKVGITALLKEKGYDNLVISIYRHEDFTSRLYVNYDCRDKDTRLIELIVREGLFRPRDSYVNGFDFSEGLSMLLIEWLALQDPKAKFANDRPRLPGQVHPGLGILRNIQDMLYRFARSGGKDAIVDVPEHYHGAVIYSKKYFFFSPVDAGQVRAMMRDLNQRPLSDASFAIACGCLVDRSTGREESWKPSEQIYPISKKVQMYVKSSEYGRVVDETARAHRYSIDWDKFELLTKQGALDEL